MPRGDKSKYTEKQKRQAKHIEQGYEERGVPEEEAERRAWATVNEMTGGGKKPGGSGRGKPINKAPAKKEGRIGGPRGGRALLGHATPVSGFGHKSRITPGYAHATWEAMVRAVESLKHPPALPTVFQSQSGKSQAKSGQRDRAEENLKVG